MHVTKLGRVVALYLDKLSNVRSLRASRKYVPSSHEVKYHLRWMLENIGERCGNDNFKAQRWLGFIQGALWVLQVFTINEMREHNHPEPPPVKDD